MNADIEEDIVDRVSSLCRTYGIRLLSSCFKFHLYKRIDAWALITLIPNSGLLYYFSL